MIYSVIYINMLNFVAGTLFGRAGRRRAALNCSGETGGAFQEEGAIFSGQNRVKNVYKQQEPLENLVFSRGS